MDERSLRWEQRFEWPMVIAALLVIPLLVIEESDFGQPWDTIGVILNWGTWLAFAAELVVMVYVTPKPMGVGEAPPVRRCRDAALTAIHPRLARGGAPVPSVPAPAPDPAPANAQPALARRDSLRGLRRRDGADRRRSRYATVETDQNLSSWDGIWWAITTVTTVGYGDSFPTMDEGRTIAMVVMFVGIGFVALLRRSSLTDSSARRSARRPTSARS